MSAVHVLVVHKVLSFIDRFAAVFILSGLLVNIGLAINAIGTASRISADERKTCVIQARGLPASHHLSSVMRDINVFLEPIRGEKEVPKRIAGRPNPAFYALVNIRQQLPAYVSITGRQPASRRC